jgi:hypothetical protein
VAAVEIAVHGWDIACACQRPQPIPPALAAGLLQAVPPLVPPAARDTLFAAPVPVSPQAIPSDQLIAWLGRSPRNANFSSARATSQTPAPPPAIADRSARLSWAQPMQ